MFSKKFAIAILLGFVSVQAQAEELDFGGMYGHRFVNGRKVAYSNPVIGRPGCPVGFNDQHIHSYNNLDWDIRVCSRPMEWGQRPLAVFGGLHSRDSRGVVLRNPLAGPRRNCPSGFNEAQVHGGSAPRDNPLYLCYKNINGSGLGQYIPFHGLVSYVEGQRSNWITGEHGCPWDSVESQPVYGENSIDWPIFMCLGDRGGRRDARTIE